MFKKLIIGVLAIGLIAVSCSDDDDNQTITPVAGTIAGGPFTFCVDNTVDNVSGITLDNTNTVGTNSTWVITDETGLILGLPPTLEAVEGVNFDEAGAGVCLIWYLRFEDGLQGAEMGMNANDLEGSFSLSNSITVTRNAKPVAGVISGGPYEFAVDGTADFATDLAIDATNATGTNSTWVITDEDLNILGLPPTLDAAKMVNFDAAGPGVCLIWYLRYEDGLQGAEMGMNAGDLEGCFALSNSIKVTRTCSAKAGVISGGPYMFTVDDTPDLATDLAIDATNAVGKNSTWVITDASGNILGLPPTLADAKMVDFDEAGPGVCLIWYLRYEDGVQGLEMGMNANDLKGCFELSNSIEVVRSAAP